MKCARDRMRPNAAAGHTPGRPPLPASPFAQPASHRRLHQLLDQRRGRIGQRQCSQGGRTFSDESLTRSESHADPCRHRQRLCVQPHRPSSRLLRGLCLIQRQSHTDPCRCQWLSSCVQPHRPSSCYFFGLCLTESESRTRSWSLNLSHGDPCHSH